MTVLLRTLLVAALLHITYSQRGEICHRQADIAFVVDSSGSINDVDPGNYNRVRQFMISLVRSLDVGDLKTRIGVVTFSNRGNVEFQLDTYQTERQVENAIRRMHYAGGNTNTSGGLYRMRNDVFNTNNGDRPNVPNTAIVITDGVSTVDSDRTIPYARLAQNEGIRMISVGIGSEVNMDELVGIASPSIGGYSTVVTVNDFTGLTNILESLLVITCITPTTPATTTPALNPVQECREAVDVVFLLDASGSIHANNFAKMKEFVKRFVEEMPIDSGVAQASVITFSTREKIEFFLKEYSDRRNMMEAIDRITYTRGSTNTASALRFAHTSAFQERNGDRRNVRDVIVLLTDGQSNDREDTLKEAKTARDKGIHIFVAGIGDWLDEHELDAIATYPRDRNRFRLASFDNLDANFRRTIRELICNNVNECERFPCRNHIKCDDMLGFYSCTCSERYGGEQCDQRCNKHADVVFALDASGSMGRENFKRSIDFVRDVISGLRIGSSESAQHSRVGFMTFSNRAEVLFDLGDYDTKFQVLNGLPPYYTGGTTNTADALQVARNRMFTRERGDQDGVPNILVLITDGKSNDEEETWKTAMEARNDGIQVVVVGVGGSVNSRELEGMASAPTSKNVILVRTFGELRNFREQLSRSICNNENECDRRPCRNGGQCTDLINGYVCKCRNGNTGVNCERRCDGRADIAFVLDASGSIHHERFPIVLDFVRKIIDSLEVAADRARVGVASWSNDANINFLLNKYKHKQDVVQAVQYIKYLGERTYTASALRMMREDIFNPRNGDREDVPNFAFIVTDGNSNINEKDTIREAIAARQAGIHIFVVSVGKQINTIELKGIASEPVRSNIYEVERFSDLQSIIDRMPRAICDDVNECNSNPCRNGGRCMNGLGRYTCRCPEGRVGFNCERSCRRQLDITFMLDLSGSVEDQYDRTIAFAKQVVYGLDMTFGRTRVAVITFGDQATTAFDLLTYREKEEVVNALSFYPNRGQTNTQAAMQQMRRDIFSSSRGDRSGVQNVGILVTDGYSNVARHNTIPEAQRAKDEDVAMYVVAIGDEVDMGEVNAIAGRGTEPPDSYVFRVRHDGQITNVADQLADRLCQWVVSTGCDKLCDKLCGKPCDGAVMARNGEVLPTWPVNHVGRISSFLSTYRTSTTPSQGLPQSLLQPVETTL